MIPLKVGGGNFFSEMREGYYMIIHVKFRISIFIIIFFLSHSSESWCAPEIWCAPGAKSYIRTRGSDHAKKIVLDLRNPKMDRNFFTIIFF